jgi:hypothetical protein
MDTRRVIESLVSGVPWPIEWTLAPVSETLVWWISVVNVWWVGSEAVQVATLLNYIWEVPSSNLDQDANYCDWGFSWHSSFPPDKRDIVLQIRPFSALSCTIHCSCHHTVWHYIVWAGWSCDSTVSTVPGLMARVLFLAVKNFSFLHSVQPDSGAHPASYPMGTKGSFPRGKVARVWSWPLTSI